MLACSSFSVSWNCGTVIHERSYKQRQRVKERTAPRIDLRVITVGEYFEDFGRNGPESGDVNAGLWGRLQLIGISPATLPGLDGTIFSRSILMTVHGPARRGRLFFYARCARVIVRSSLRRHGTTLSNLDLAFTMTTVFRARFVVTSAAARDLQPVASHLAQRMTYSVEGRRGRARVRSRGERLLSARRAPRCLSSESKERDRGRLATIQG